MSRINIIGFGFVGSAMGSLCEHAGLEYSVYDTMTKSGKFNYYSSLNTLITTAEEKYTEPVYYFICVPTPSDIDGSCNILIIDKVLEEMRNTIKNNNSVIFIKSTVKPGTCNNFSTKYPELNIIFCPEFLREKTAKEDVINADFVLFGIDDKFNRLLCEGVYELFRELYKHNSDIRLLLHTYEECELFKYTINCFLATKVWFFNEIYQVCDKLDVTYDNLCNLLKLDARIGESHTQVPGHDGHFGYGLSCFPKEMRGMSFLQNELGIDNNILSSIIKRNDWMRTLE